MAHSQSACPICRKLITDPNQEKCDQCRWILNTENLLNPKIRNSLIEWAIYHNQRADELDRKDYNYVKLENRLHRHRDDIDRLQQTIDSFVNIPEIKSILSSNQIAVSQKTDIPTIQSINSVDENNLFPIMSDTESNKTSQKEESLNSAAPVLTQIEQDMISEYYHHLNRFAEKYQVKTINITKESISANWASEKKNVVLEEVNRGNYWIFNLEDKIYLVPSEEIYVDQNTYTTTSTVFECHNYSQEYEKIQLVKPALVRADSVTDHQTWKMYEQGVLKFL